MDIKEIAEQVSKRIYVEDGLLLSKIISEKFAEALIESYKAELLKEVGEPVLYAEFAEDGGWLGDASEYADHLEKPHALFTSDQLAAAIIKATKPLEEENARLNGVIESNIDDGIDKIMAMSDEQVSALAGFEGSNPEDKATIARQCMDIAMLRVELSALKEENETAWAQAHRLALELECLLLDTKDNATVSKWWDSGMAALDEYQQLKPGAQEEAEAWVKMRMCNEHQ